MVTAERLLMERLWNTYFRGTAGEEDRISRNSKINLFAKRKINGCIYYWLETPRGPFPEKKWTLFMGLMIRKSREHGLKKIKMAATSGWSKTSLFFYMHFQLFSQSPSCLILTLFPPPLAALAKPSPEVFFIGQQTPLLIYEFAS